MRPLWIKFASLCRRQNKLDMSRRVLTNLLGVDKETQLNEIPNLPLDKPALLLAICKQLWIEKHYNHARTTLEKLVTSMDHDRVSFDNYFSFWCTSSLFLSNNFSFWSTSSLFLPNVSK